MIPVQENISQEYNIYYYDKYKKAVSRKPLFRRVCLLPFIFVIIRLKWAILYVVDQTEGRNVFMKSSFRWYGESDPVKLEYIRQIPGMRSIVSAVYDVKPGEVWPEESIRHLTELCREHGLIFDVVESIPVTEEIKLGKPEREQHIQNYCESVRRCAKYGIKCITYNFMPVFDWTRTQLDKMAEDGSTSLVMYWEQMKGLDPLKDDIHLPGWMQVIRKMKSVI